MRCFKTIPLSPDHAIEVTFWPGEQVLLLPAPTTPCCDIPLWSEPKVGRDQLAAVDRALYSIPHPYVGQRVTARADAQIVCVSTRDS